MDRGIKVAFVTLEDVKDKRAWSGVLYSMSRSLEKHLNGEIHYINPADSLKNRTLLNMLALSNLGLKKGFKKHYFYKYNGWLCRNLSSYVEREIQGKDIDLIFAPASSYELAFLNTNLPIVYTSDATFRLIYCLDDKYADVLKFSLRRGNLAERSSIEKSDLLIYPSEWAAESAVNDYGADESKVHVVPLGANVEEVPPEELVLKRRPSDSCDLLFLGVDWDRKGGEIAFETLLELEKLGINATLTVCGCTPPREFVHERMVVLPFLDKNDEKQRRQLDDLYLKSDFLFLPTRSEAFGMVFCDASAFGLPVITTDTGGVSGAVEEGKNGFMLPLDADASSYAELIAKLFLDDDLYRGLVVSSRRTFDEKLNWDSWGRRVSGLIRGVVETSGG